VRSVTVTVEKKYGHSAVGADMDDGAAAAGAGVTAGAAIATDLKAGDGADDDAATGAGDIGVVATPQFFCSAKTARYC
jgi:hypothetical protein